MAHVHTTYLNICSSNGFDHTCNKVRTRRELKVLLGEEIPVVVFTSAKQKNESERVYLASSVDAAMWILEEDNNEHQLRTLLNAAMLIRKIAQSSERWKFNECLSNDKYNVHEPLALFFKWCLVGKATLSEDVSRRTDVDERSSRLGKFLCLNICLHVKLHMSVDTVYIEPESFLCKSVSD